MADGPPEKSSPVDRKSGASTPVEDEEDADHREFLRRKMLQSRQQDYFYFEEKVMKASLPALQRTLLELAKADPESIQHLRKVLQRSAFETLEDPTSRLKNKSYRKSALLAFNGHSHLPFHISPHSHTSHQPHSSSTDSPSPKVEGYLLLRKPKSHKFKRRWVSVDSENMRIWKDVKDKGVEKPTIINLLCTSCRKADEEKLVLFSPHGKFEITSEDKEEVKEWMKAIQDVSSTLIHQSIGTNQVKTQQEEEIPESVRILKKELQERPGNQVCGECGEEEPEWMSLNLGVFLCINCSGSHRALGVHFSKVRSFQYDVMETDQLENLRKLGNEQTNSIFEYTLQNPETLEENSTASDSLPSKPTANSTLNDRSNWVKAKYVDLSFVDPKSNKVKLREQFSISERPTLGSATSSPSLGTSRLMAQSSDSHSPGTTKNKLRSMTMVFNRRDSSGKETVKNNPLFGKKLSPKRKKLDVKKNGPSTLRGGGQSASHDTILWNEDKETFVEYLERQQKEGHQEGRSLRLRSKSRSISSIYELT